MPKSNDFISPQKAGGKLTNHARRALSSANDLARDLTQSEIRNVHLFCAIFSQDGSMGSIIMRDLGIRKSYLRSYSPKKPAGAGAAGATRKKTDFNLSEELKKSLTRAWAIAKRLNYGYVGTEHLIYALLEAKDAEIQKIIAKSKVKKTGKLRQTGVRQNEISDKFFKNIPWPPDFFDLLPEDLANTFPSDFAGLAQPAREGFADSLEPQKIKKTAPLAHVQKFCTDLNRRAAEQKEAVVGREKEIERIIDILGRKNKNNPLLVGHPGVGKTALVMGLAQRINEGATPRTLAGKIIMSLDVASLVAGTSFRGEFESRLKEIVREVSENKKIILFIDEVHNIVGAGNASGSLDLANILKPALSQGDIRLIGATTFSEYKKHIEKDAALERRFQPVTIKEPTREEACEILLGIKKHYEDFHGVTIRPEILRLTVELSDRYIKNRFLPDKAIDVIDEAAARLRNRNRLSDLAGKIADLENELEEIAAQKEKLVADEDYSKAVRIQNFEKKEREKIKFMKDQLARFESENRPALAAEHIFETVAGITSIPKEKLARGGSEKVKNISTVLRAQIIGQEEAAKKIASALLRSHSGLENADRPLASFLFLGPSGVGKTLTAKVLARYFFSGLESFVRLDMSELSERHSISALLGSPAGYVGYGEGGRLTEKIRRNPYSVVLFDEVEKAHPDVLNILLQLLEEGTLTDAEGLEVSFKNTIIILTANVAADELSRAARIGFSDQANRQASGKNKGDKESALRALERKIKPEILNRLDDILIFNPLEKSDLEKIAELETEKLREKLGSQAIEIVFSPKAIRLIAQKSARENQGARLVRKNVRELLENPIAEMIVFGTVKERKIKAEVKNGKIKLL
jgi:ATP-dependent Clp protease ATP-binding subunit ClpC